MGKRKNQENQPQHATQSFQQLVASATLAKFSGYIDQQIQGLSRALLQRQAQAQEKLMVRIMSLEEIVMELNPAITKETLADRVATIQDRHEDFEAVSAEGVVELGDRIRLELSTRTADQTAFQGASRLQIDGAGTGQTVGAELESAMLGMKAGETKEVKFGKDESLLASITVNRVSRKPKVTQVVDSSQPVEGESELQAGETAEEAEERVVAQVKAEVPNASADAG